ncbi:helix-turn-helix domain-containing protein [Morganella morganii]|nr:helix-turn-helix transcriptional regulator [Morganella morganii]UVZ55953.1 helix-turn-helix transcriptional regulator [Morganella morganii]
MVRLAEDMGITQQQFNRYERGTYTLSDVSGRNVPCSGGLLFRSGIVYPR